MSTESLPLFGEERDRLEREQRKLSRKEYGSNNWEKQRRRVAECHQQIKRKRRDFLHKLSNYYAREYKLVAVEDLNLKGMLESPGNSRNTASAAWNIFTDLLEYKCKHEDTHFVEVDPEDTTKECASCGVKTDKPLWVREHSCPARGFEADRDANAAWNILFRGLTDLGVGHSEGTSSESWTDSDVRTNRPAIRQRLWRLRSLRTPIRCLQSASSKQEASGLDPEAIHNVGTGESYTFNEMIAMINDELGTNVDPKYIENPLQVYVHDTMADYSKIQEVTGWEPQIDFEEGVARVCKSYQ